MEGAIEWDYRGKQEKETGEENVSAKAASKLVYFLL